MNLILLGAPGAGKGTTAKKLVAQKNMVQISTGDILRNEIKKESELGLKAKQFMDAGDLVPDSIILGIIEKRLQEDDCKNGFILDGFPRTINQADGLKDILKNNKLEIKGAVDIKVPEKSLIKRLSSRRTCSNSNCQAIYNITSMPPLNEGICDKCGSQLIQRSDETEKAIQHRLKTYNEKTAPLIKYYKNDNNFIEVDGNQDPDNVVQDLLQKLNFE